MRTVSTRTMADEVMTEGGSIDYAVIGAWRNWSAQDNPRGVQGSHHRRHLAARADGIGDKTMLRLSKLGVIYFAGTIDR